MDTLQVERDLKIKEILNKTTKSKEVFRNIIILIFLVKITNQIDWSWWWVTSLWIGFLVLFIYSFSNSHIYYT
jgi:hypothetical protein